jgi:hypothetical protein
MSEEVAPAMLAALATIILNIGTIVAAAWILQQIGIL